MTVLKCKMCGGDLEVTLGSSVAECLYCGAQQTVVTSEDEGIQTLFNRANILRMKSEFDKAAEIYEKILQRNESEPEAYWGLVLCKYGIEYVEDPASLKRVPTCHRASYDAVVADEDYKNALKYADFLQKDIYEKEAKTIDEIQKGIIALAQNEAPYDVFICYKETDEAGRRTQDSVIANDIYHQLTQEGFKVFYAAITLEDKLGKEYEPIIFSALNTAKVMLVVGTRPEYFNAVWVKNEWSRFLKIMKKEHSKLLVPCYKDMDPYELPDEFAHLQAQDMSKIGFINDLVRGIKKVIVRDQEKNTAKETVIVQQSAGNMSAMAQVKRGNIALDDTEWDNAEHFFEEALNYDPECAEAYIGKMLANAKCRSLRQYFEHLKMKYRQQKTITRNACLEEAEHIHQKALEYRIEGFLSEDEIQKMYSFNRTFQSDSDYWSKAETLLNKELRENKYLNRARQYAAEDYKDELETGISNIKKWVAEKAASALSADKEKTEEISGAYAAYLLETDKKVALRHNELMKQKEEELSHKYEECCFREDKAKTEKEFRDIAEAFIGINGYRDAKAHAEQCLLNAEKLKEKRIELQRKSEEIRREEAARREELRKEEAAASAKKAKRKVTVITVIIVLALAALFFVTRVAIPKSKYNAALELMDHEQYMEAISAFEEIGDYKDSQEQIKLCKNAIKENDYAKAMIFMNDGKYEDAIKAFQALERFRDSSAQIQECNYLAALSTLETGNIVQAYESLTALNGYKDSAEKAEEIYGRYKNINLCTEIAGKKVGDTFLLGTYEQDNTESNGKEDIDWIILQKQEDKALVISKYGLDYQAFHDGHEDSISWDNCSLRSWLNNNFLNEAFSSDEQSLIAVTVVNPSIHNEEFGSGIPTNDKVFLLSEEEIEEFVRLSGKNDIRVCEGTKYMAEKYLEDYGYQVKNRKDYSWWLRTTGFYWKDRASVCTESFCDFSSIELRNAVRPVMWLDLSEQ